MGVVKRANWPPTPEEKITDTRGTLLVQEEGKRANGGGELGQSPARAGKTALLAGSFCVCGHREEEIRPVSQNSVLKAGKLF